MEIALTYGCPESVDRERLVEYVHHNRNLNARRISTMGEDFFVSKPLTKELRNTHLSRENN